MAFTPVNEFEQILVQAANDPAMRPEFYRGILQHELFVLAENQHSAGAVQPSNQKSSQLNLRQLELEGKLHIPIFTSVERISAVVGSEVSYVAMLGADLLPLLRGQDAVLNPGSDFGKLMTPDEIAQIIDGSIFEPSAMIDVPANQRMLLGQPTDYPAHITEALCSYFAKQSEVKAAYLAHAAVADDPEGAHTLIGIHTKRNWSRLVEDAVVVAREVARDGEVVDFLQVHPSEAANAGSVAGYLLNETTPFYKRKLFGLF